jgi:hypothetical protein
MNHLSTTLTICVRTACRCGAEYFWVPRRTGWGLIARPNGDKLVFRFQPYGPITGVTLVRLGREDLVVQNDVEQ